MGQAGPAAPGKLAAQRLSGAMQPDAGVPGRDPCLGGKTAHAEAVHIDAAKCRTVFGLEGVHERRDAGARDGFQLRVRRRRPILSLSSKPSKRAASGAFASVMVDEGIAKHAVEPGGRGLWTSQRAGPADAADERLLQNVLRFIPGAYTALDKAEETGVIVHQQAEHVRRVRVALSGLGQHRLGRVGHRS